MPDDVYTVLLSKDHLATPLCTTDAIGESRLSLKQHDPRFFALNYRVTVASRLYPSTDMASNTGTLPGPFQTYHFCQALQIRWKSDSSIPIANLPGQRR